MRSDRLPVAFTIKRWSLNYEKTRCKLIIDLRQANFRKLCEQISVLSWEKLYEESNTSCAVDNFLRIVTPIFESTCPLKPTRKKERDISSKTLD